jgi:hypothetical protein
MTSDGVSSEDVIDHSAFAQAIARHAWENHAAEFRLLHPPVETEEELAAFIGDILQHEEPMPAARGRTLYLHGQTGTVVIVNPADAINRGTAFRPLDPDDYVARVVGDIQ